LPPRPTPPLNQLDYGAELSKLRATKPDAVYIFLPGGMGINFIKQFVGAGLSKDITLFGPGFSGDEDVIKAVGDPMLGMFNTSQWGHDMDNAANKKFVAEFEKEYGRLPTLYAAQGYDAARLMDAGVRDSKGKLDDKAAVQARHWKPPSSTRCVAPSSSTPTTSPSRTTTCASSPATPRVASPTAPWAPCSRTTPTPTPPTARCPALKA